MNKEFFYVTNWKAYLTFNQSAQWAQKNKNALASLAKNYQIVICPSFDALATVNAQLQGTGISIGAQNCSAHEAGAYTGQILVQSLKEIGCAYCFIGHSEVRQEFHETTEQIAQKACLLLAAGIIPIICIGESAQDYELGKGAQVIEEQLRPIFKKIAAQKTVLKTLLIGYEPLWAIGAGNTPRTDYLKSQLEVINRLAKELAPGYKTVLLYGGSINETNIRTLKDTPLLDGVLIGHASTDFQTLEKIVLL